jgi:hypothetical protein
MFFSISSVSFLFFFFQQGVREMELEGSSGRGGWASRQKQSGGGGDGCN